MGSLLTWQVLRAQLCFTFCLSVAEHLSAYYLLALLPDILLLCHTRAGSGPGSLIPDSAQHHLPLPPVTVTWKCHFYFLNIWVLLNSLWSKFKNNYHMSEPNRPVSVCGLDQLTQYPHSWTVDILVHLAEIRLLREIGQRWIIRKLLVFQLRRHTVDLSCGVSGVASSYHNSRVEHC